MKSLQTLFVLSVFFIHLVFGVTGVDFSTYRPGMNNRPLYQSIIKDLGEKFGTPVQTAYRKGFEAQIDRIVIDEDLMDKYLQEAAVPQEREAIARFILAHEYFHVLLKHPHTSERGESPKEIQIRGTFTEARREMEKQVDHLAAKYLHDLKLPTKPVERMFQTHPELVHGGDCYPSGEERAKIVSEASKPGIEMSYFDNKAIKCTFFLNKLAARFPREMPLK